MIAPTSPGRRCSFAGRDWFEPRQCSRSFGTHPTSCPSRACVLIVGETGTGKELIAAPSTTSARDTPVLTFVSTAALDREPARKRVVRPRQGIVHGAVDNRTGRFEAAHTGSIFLDEINSTSPKLQVKLLRVLQEGEFERGWRHEYQKVDTRIVAATNRDLLDEIDSGRFREDLYYRLNVVPIYLPALRERRDDIVLLVESFLKRYADRESARRAAGPSRGDATAPRPRLAGQRSRATELRRARRDLGRRPRADRRASAAPVARGGDASSDPIARGRPHRHDLRAGPPGVRAAGPQANDLHKRIVDQVERELIQQVLQSCERVQIKAAARLGINRNTLHKKLAQYRIDGDESGGGGNGDGHGSDGSTPLPPATRSKRIMSGPPTPAFASASLAWASTVSTKGTAWSISVRWRTGSTDLVFADPLAILVMRTISTMIAAAAEQYLAWTDLWAAEVTRVLKPTGTFGWPSATSTRPSSR